MRIKKYWVKDDEKDFLVKKILPKLFPEFEFIEERPGNVIRFSKYKKGSFKRFLSSMYDTDYVIDIHLFELLVYHIPRKLSYYKAGNYTFTPMYTSFIFSIVLSEPKYLIPYIIREFEQIRSPYVEQTTENFFDILNSDETLKVMNNNVEKAMSGMFEDSDMKKNVIFTVQKL